MQATASARKWIATVLLALFLTVVFSAGARAHGEAEELFEEAEVTFAPYVDNSPSIDGVVSVAEYAPMGQWVDEDSEFVTNLARDAESLFVALSNPGSGWMAIGFSSDLEEGMGFVLIGMVNGTLVAETRIAPTVSDEVSFEVPPSPGKDTVRAFNASVQSGKNIAELRLPLESDLWTLEGGTLVPTVVAFNETSADLPTTTEGSEVHFLRTYLFRPQDNPEEIQQLFAAEISPVQGLVAVSVMGIGIAAIVAASVRREEAEP